jgi:hypothetical protein
VVLRVVFTTYKYIKGLILINRHYDSFLLKISHHCTFNLHSNESIGFKFGKSIDKKVPFTRINILLFTITQARIHEGVMGVITFPQECKQKICIKKRSAIIYFFILCLETGADWSLWQCGNCREDFFL